MIALRRQASLLLVSVLMTVSVSATSEATPSLRSLAPEAVLSKLDLDLPGLEAVNAAVKAGNRPEALTALLAYYRAKYPQGELKGKVNEARLVAADNVVNHIFQWGPYESAEYGDEIRWDWDPRGDIEWVAAVYRFHWAQSLVGAYADTRDEKYAASFVELTRDWIAKHPLEEHTKTHYVYDHWRGFAWLDIQTGIRAATLSRSFPHIVHADAFTPEFLAILLASLYDHQVKTEKLPMNRIHNKAIFEQRGFVTVAHTFSEFKESKRWMTLSMARLKDNFLAQVTSDGVQREWSGGYHSGVLRDALEIMKLMESFDVPIPEDFRERVQAMFGYIFGIATPELAYPMFGDTSRYPMDSPVRAKGQLYSFLMQATEMFGDPKYAARATLDLTALPAQTSYAFREAGMYALRDAWGPEQVYFALHCSPPAISSHDQADNGTFELKAYGRWLMNDSGYYTYGHDPEGRAWHRQTRVHQTLTLDNKDHKRAGKSLLWHTTPQLTTVAVENDAYKGLTHRRTVWFVDGRFFVLLDEAIGDAPGALDLHFQFAPGELAVDTAQHWATTRFDDVNVLVWEDPDAPVTLTEEEGWYAWAYGKRTARPVIRYRHNAAVPAAYLTLIVPYKGKEIPEVTASLPETFQIGADHVEVRVEAFGEIYDLDRDLKQ